MRYLVKSKGWYFYCIGKSLEHGDSGVVWTPNQTEAAIFWDSFAANTVADLVEGKPMKLIAPPKKKKK